MEIENIPPSMMTDDKFMELAVREAYDGIRRNDGGPFGAVIVHKETHEVVAYGHNTVLKDKDPTAHGEINAIRNACKELDSIDLSDYKLYTTGYPCPMCLGAIEWANIDEVHYGILPETINAIGFKDKKMYEGSTKGVTTSICGKEVCDDLIRAYENMPHEIY